MSNAIERLSKIVDREEFDKWYDSLYYDELVSDIQEVVALAKESKQPSIDTMRFEAAKTAMAALIVKYPEDFDADTALYACIYADKLIAELQKQKP